MQSIDGTIDSWHKATARRDAMQQAGLALNHSDYSTTVLTASDKAD